MGCSASKLEDEEAVKLCRERRNFVKQAVEQRTRFAAGHRAYIQSLRQVSDALRGYVERDDHHHDFFSDSCSTPPFTPVKRLSSSPEIIGIPCKSFTPAMEATHESSRKMIHCLRAGGNPAAVMVEERPPSPETARVSTHYYPSEHYSIDGFFSMQSPPMATGSSFFSSASPPRRTSIPPPSPQNPQWDFFWNPFSSLDTYGYASQSSPERRTMMAAEEDELAGLRQIREEEGIPELEEEELPKPVNFDERRKKVVEAAVDLPAELNQARAVDHSTPETKQQVREFEFHAADGVKAAVAAAAAGVEAVGAWPPELAEVEAAEETPGFTVYLNCRPTSMAEVMRDIEHQFIRIHDSAREVALMLEVGKAQRSSSNELTVALFRSASFRSSSSLPSRFLPASSAARDDGGDDSGSDVSDESCMISGSHQSTLERLFAWEKKLYEEVKSGERVRMAYERKRMQLRKQDINGEDPSVVDRTRIAVRDLQTQLKVSIHSVEAISKRIEKLRDEELCPQLLELIQGMSRMWRTVADCHQIQKAAIDGAKHLLATAPKLAAAPPPLSRPAARLEAELRNWRSCLRVWVDAQDATSGRSPGGFSAAPARRRRRTMPRWRGGRLCRRRDLAARRRCSGSA
ncbi:unnamed protein product [Spirodela intermedia]|uniref:Uncharacterized protein n=1 Tax=Spirodela intermedia TaxID=51605 RepID=A0A7I8JPP8_SPIIN|nr:unnamed protein product [Spirodela intermedia]CAA6672158.1 unnamed protein product [Spirodela intermedia]